MTHFKVQHEVSMAFQSAARKCPWHILRCSKKCPWHILRCRK